MHRATSPSSPTKKDPYSMEKSQPVYSDFSHMGTNQSIGNVKFAVGLRSDDPDKLIERIFPLTKIIPHEKKEEKKSTKKTVKKVEEKVCTRSDCLYNKEKLNTLRNDNKNYRLKLSAIENNIEKIKNKINLTEKSNLMMEENNDNMNGKIEAILSNMKNITNDIEKTESFNQTLRKQLEKLEKDIEAIKEKTKNNEKELDDILNEKKIEKVKFGKSNNNNNNNTMEFFALSKEVSELDSKYHSDSD